MTSSTDKAEPTNSESAQNDFSQADQPEESHASDSKTPKVSPIENEEPLESSVNTDDGTDLEPEEEEVRNQLLRAMADNENLRKRTEREVAAAKKYGPFSFVRDLLASIDNLEKAISTKPDDASMATMIAHALPLGNYQCITTTKP